MSNGTGTNAKIAFEETSPLSKRPSFAAYCHQNHTTTMTPSNVTGDKHQKQKSYTTTHNQMRNNGYTVPSSSSKPVYLSLNQAKHQGGGVHTTKHHQGNIICKGSAKANPGIYSAKADLNTPTKKVGYQNLMNHQSGRVSLTSKAYT